MQIDLAAHPWFFSTRGDKRKAEALGPGFVRCDGTRFVCR